jgi:hypothetical protein
MYIIVCIYIYKRFYVQHAWWTIMTYYIGSEPEMFTYVYQIASGMHIQELGFLWTKMLATQGQVMQSTVVQVVDLGPQSSCQMLQGQCTCSASFQIETTGAVSTVPLCCSFLSILNLRPIYTTQSQRACATLALFDRTLGHIWQHMQHEHSHLSIKYRMMSFVCRKPHVGTYWHTGFRYHIGVEGCG